MNNLIHFSALASLDPRDVSGRTGCQFDEIKNEYIVKIWGHSYNVNPEKRVIIPEKEGIEARPDFLCLFILYYLIKSKNINAGGEWISEKDMAGGATFFRGPHKIPTELITEKFKNGLGLFKTKCENLNGVQIGMADAAFAFRITNNIPIAVLYWEGDEDFGNEAKLLFDKTVKQQLPLDIVFVLAAEVCGRLASP